MPIDGGGPSGLPVPSVSYATVLGQILALAGQQLQDISGTTWGGDVMVPYVNLAVIEICVLKPEAYPVTVNIEMAAGATQELADEAIELLDVICNMGTSGTTPGKAIRMLAKEAVDLLLPDWATYPAGSVVQFIMVDSRNPKYFYTIPPMDSSKPKIKVIQAEMPAAIEDTDGEFPLDASYIPATVDYIIYRALAESTTIPGAMEKAKTFFSKFMQDLGLKTVVEKQTERKEQGQAPTQQQPVSG